MSNDIQILEEAKFNDNISSRKVIVIILILEKAKFNVKMSSSKVIVIFPNKPPCIWHKISLIETINTIRIKL